ncbi:hypothetical protein [Streptomyces sp. WMMB303]|nr:hypothetical protein [Streptomyces sp. WMMB303]MDF4254380.1 hypothetical protein [Streptomyces sp. WMMB303]
MGNFLIKAGSRPGSPVHAEPAADEVPVNNTNKHADEDPTPAPPYGSG